MHLRTGRAAMVEDDPDVVACAQLAAGGVPLEVYADGEQALQALFSAADLPAVLLLDLELPGLHGLEVLERLRSRGATRHLPVVVFTGTGTDPAEGYRRGANAWVEKPRDADALEQAVEQIIGFWLGHNHPARAPVALR